MKRLLIGVITAGLILTGATTVLGATYKSPAEVYAELKGITVEEASAEKAAGSSYGTLANNAGLLEEFKAKMLENKKARIQDRVESGRMTQEQADAMIIKMEQRSADCYGTNMGANSGNMGQKMGGMFGKGRGMASDSCWGGQGTQ